MAGLSYSRSDDLRDIAEEISSDLTDVQEKVEQLISLLNQTTSYSSDNDFADE